MIRKTVKNMNAVEIDWRLEIVWLGSVLAQ